MSMAHKNIYHALNEQKTFLHRMNPALKVAITIFFIVLIFLPTGLFTQAAILFIIISLFIATKLPANKIKAIFKTVLVIFIISFILNWLTNKNPYIVFDIQDRYNLWGWSFQKLYDLGWIRNSTMPVDMKIHLWYHGQILGGSVANVLTDIKPTSGSYITVANNLYLQYSAPWYSLSSHTLIQTISINLKIFMVLSILSLEINTTSTLGLSYGVATILTPLKFIKVPVTQISTVIAIALKFVPNLLAEANRVIDAQASRGSDLRNGNLFIKIKVLATLIVPMFSIAFNKADILADSMEARNFNPAQKRSRYRQYCIQYYDWLFFALLLSLIILFSVMVGMKVIIGPAFLIDINII